MSVLVEAEHLTRAYGSMRALDDLSFSVDSGEWIAIMGPSGSGKTTLVNIIGGLDAPTGGRVVVDGADIGGMDESALTRYRAEKVGFVFQQFHLVPYLTARGLGARGVAAGCARCQACSAMSLLETPTDDDGRTFLPLLSNR